MENNKNAHKFFESVIIPLGTYSDKIRNVYKDMKNH